MAQLTIYLDDESDKIVKTAAKRAKTSLSQWVKKCILSHSESAWPVGYFDLFGSLKDQRLKRPKQLSFKADNPREKL